MPDLAFEGDADRHFELAVRYDEPLASEIKTRTHSRSASP
jgi:hypothetical protein